MPGLLHAAPEAHSPAASPERRLHRGRSSRVGRQRPPLLALAVLALVLLAAIAAPLLAPHDPARQHLQDAFSSPNAEYLLGADHLGRDLLSRLLFGARTTLLTAVAVLALTSVIGVSVGVLAGFYGGWTDALLMRLTDLLLAFPALLLAVAVAGTLGQSMFHLALSLIIVGWPGLARTTRGLVLTCREQEYVLAARALGAPRRRIMTKHLLPNVIGPVLVLGSLEFGTIILSIAGLNFLGLGVQPPVAELGAMLRAAQPHLQTDPQLLVYPSAAIVLIVLSVNALADRRRDVLDPTHRR
jgi:ABC-type dipeptide/oligopeptide/nickel transport system permease subunit